ncbi:MAG: hypothetical protein GQ474_05940 [Sulfurimonas sp.]|nr:hypothetical protein [Sulfurimonas sp.]
MIDNLATLRNCKDFYEVHQSPYFQKHFVRKYINDLPRLAFDLFGVKLTYQQIDILTIHDWEGGRLAVPSGHGIGKTFLLAFIALCHTLLFPKSITRIQAPKSEQVTKFSFKEIKNALSNLEQPRRINGKIVVGEWAFLAKFFQLNTELIYIKGYKEGWYIEPATAPKGDPTNLSGQHNMFYLLLFDECSGIEDSHIDGSLGALSERFNSCISFSQHTRTSGRFHEWVTTRSIAQGGVWNVLRTNSEQSPRVTAKAIENWRATYTENEYQVRVLGLPPIFEDGFLLNSLEANRAYTKKGKEWIDKLHFNTLALSTDVSYTGLRDSSVVTLSRVAVELDKRGVMKLYIIIDDINVYQGKNGKKPIETANETFNLLLKKIDESEQLFQFKRLCTDATAGGYEAYTTLDELVNSAGLGDAHVQPIIWGSGRLTGFDKKRFSNQRAKANIMLKEAVAEGRFYIATNKYKTRILAELTHIPFAFTSKFQYKIASKEEMKKKGINSPDIIDTFAQKFLMNFVPPSERDLAEQENEEEYDEDLDDLEELDESLDDLDEEIDILDDLDIDKLEDFGSSLIM